MQPRSVRLYFPHRARGMCGIEECETDTVSIRGKARPSSTTIYSCDLSGVVAVCVADIQSVFICIDNKAAIGSPPGIVSDHISQPVRVTTGQRLNPHFDAAWLVHTKQKLCSVAGDVVKRARRRNRYFGRLPA